MAEHPVRRHCGLAHGFVLRLLSGDRDGAPRPAGRAMASAPQIPPSKVSQSAPFFEEVKVARSKVSPVLRNSLD
jgi:hypothetical protein